MSAATWPVTCAWCSAEGRVTVVGFTTVAGSSGICPAHAAAVLAEVRASRAALR